MRTPPRLEWRAWSGLIVSPIAWAGHHQFGSNLNFYDCDIGRGWLAASIGLLGFIVTAAAGALSWSARRLTQPIGFIALLGVMAAALLALTIAIQVGAALILPPCFR